MTMTTSNAPTDVIESEIKVMSSDGPRNLLAQLDAQQNEVIKELDELNAQIENLLRQCSEERSSRAA
jgi:hypothetical protein